MQDAEASISAALRGVPGVWRELTGPAAEERFLSAAAEHRVRALLAWRLHQSGELRLWAESVRRALVDAERGEAALEIVRRHELCRLLQGFAAVDVPVLLLKGAALAYSLYPEPWLRPREDNDLLVRGEDAGRARQVLVAAGYRPARMQSGAFVAHQRLYVRPDAAGRRYACDLHWKIANPAPFADLLSPDELLREADTFTPGEGCVARIPGRLHALLLACWHRVSHHRNTGDLLWLYDIHLLADGLDDAEAARLREIGRRTGTLAVCTRGLSLAAERFHTRIPPALLADEPSDDPRSSIAVYLRPDARKVDLLAADLRSLPDWRSRVRLLREHLFPPAEYMLAASDRSSRAALPALYAWRIARGAWSWFRRP